MNKSELIASAADTAGMSKGDMNSALDAIVQTITDSVAAGEKVSVTDFGNFDQRENAARKGRNPQTGEEIDINASKTPRFKAAKRFKEAVNR
ncbi:HU family DNA-binding protein [soil metagenome]|jgi:DNA-binding protein HU-beta